LGGRPLTLDGRIIICSTKYRVIYHVYYIEEINALSSLGESFKIGSMIIMFFIFLWLNSLIKELLLKFKYKYTILFQSCLNEL